MDCSGSEWPPHHRLLGDGRASMHDDRVNLVHRQRPFRLLHILSVCCSGFSCRHRPVSLLTDVPDASQQRGECTLRWGHTRCRSGPLLPLGYVLRGAQPDGNFVEYRVADGADYQFNGGSVVQWYTGTGGEPSTSLAMQTDGNLVLYASGTPLWSSSTALSANDRLAMQDDGNLVVYNSATVPLWSSDGGRTPFQGDQLPAGFQLNTGQAIYSPSGTYDAVMQADGNFVVYAVGGAAQWSTATGGSGATEVAMQADGNLVVYNPSKAVWASGTAPSNNDNLTMQDDGNLVIYAGNGKALWSKNSGLIGGGGGGPTAAETAAVNWAISKIGSTSFGSLCLTLVQEAYANGAGVNFEPLTNFGTFNSNTYPQEVWNAGFKSGATGGSGTTPPYGALVFYNASGPGASDPSDYSHVTIMGSGGEMISTNDVVNEGAVHYRRWLRSPPSTPTTPTSAGGCQADHK